MRRVRSLVRRTEDGVSHGSNFDDYLRKTYGIEKEFFINFLFSKEFSYRWLTKWFISIYIKFRPVYFELFNDDLKEAIKNCETEGYITLSENGLKKYIKETDKGRKMLSIWYFPRLILKNEYVKTTLIKCIEWGVPLLGFYIASHWFNITIQSK